MIETVQTQIAEHLDALERDIRELRMTLLPVPDARAVWALGATCRMTGSVFMRVTAEVERLEREAVERHQGNEASRHQD